MFLLFFSNKKGKSTYVVGLDSLSCQQVSSRLASTKIFDLQYSRGRIRDRVWSRILSHQVLRKEPFLLLSLSPFQGQTSRERLEKRRESLGPTETTRTPTVPLSFFPIRTEYYSALSTLTHARTLTYADSRTLRHLVAAYTKTHA